MIFEKRARIKEGPNITPLIDVVFILLIFFMLTSSFIEQEGIELTLPQAESSSSLENDTATVSISEDGTVYFNAEAVSIDELAKRAVIFVRDNPKGAVHIESDMALSVAKLVEVMDTLRKSGAQNLGIMTQKN